MVSQFRWQMARQLNSMLTDIVTVTEENVDEYGLFCIKDKKSKSYELKHEWFINELNSGLRIKILLDEVGKQLGFIEYISSEHSWRPIKAKNYLFIQCIVIFSKKLRGQDLGSTLIQICEDEARTRNKTGICVVTSKGPWVANKSIFEKNGFKAGDKLGRFELMVKKIMDDGVEPKFIDWTKKQNELTGWNLFYSDQCPWHNKSVDAIMEVAEEKGLEISVTKLESANEAQNSPSGFGTFALLKDNKLLVDHYVSKTRFQNIVRDNI